METVGILQPTVNNLVINVRKKALKAHPLEMLAKSMGRKPIEAEEGAGEAEGEESSTSELFYLL